MPWSKCTSNESWAATEEMLRSMKTCDSDTLQQLLLSSSHPRFFPAFRFFSLYVSVTGCCFVNITSLCACATWNAVRMHCPFPSKRRTMMKSQNKDECHIIAFLLSAEGLNMKLTFISAAYEPELQKRNGKKAGGGEKNPEKHSESDICTFDSTGSETQMLAALNPHRSVWLHNPLTLSKGRVQVKPISTARLKKLKEREHTATRALLFKDNTTRRYFRCRSGSGSRGLHPPELGLEFTTFRHEPLKVTAVSVTTVLTVLTTLQQFSYCNIASE